MAASTSQGSLRDLYSSPGTSWTFVPEAALGSQASSSTAATSATRQWSTRPSSSSPVFDLSPSLDLYDAGSAVPLKTMLKMLVASAFLRYSTTAIAMPWEVGKLLLQVQWIPKEAEPPTPPVQEEQILPDDDAEMSDTSSTDGDYFHDPSTPTAASRRQTIRPLRPVDQEGYVIRTSVYEAATRPDYVLPVGPSDGVWGMIKRLIGSRTEGWFSLWKGLLTYCLHEVLYATIQPFIHNSLEPISPRDSIIVPVTAHLVTGILLSPLDLLRTRQVIHPKQSSPSPFTLFRQILREEGGLKNVYLHPRLLIPAILDNTVRPIITLSLPSFIYQNFGLREDLHPVAYPIFEFLGTSMGYLITLPIETVRRRLQAQTGNGEPVKSCVELRPRPYTGTLNATWKILSEERSRPAPRKKPRTGKEQAQTEDTDSLISRTGIGQLYRGLGMSLSAGALVLVLALIAGGEEEAGWTEL